MSLDAVCITTNVLSKVHGLAADGDTAIATWRDDTDDGPVFDTQVYRGQGVWNKGPRLVGLPAVVAWMREQGATHFTVVAFGEWDGETYAGPLAK